MRYLPVVVIAVSACAAAQTTYSTSPAGMLAREGASFFAMVNGTRYQAVDQTQVNRKIKMIQSLTFRRNGNTLVRSSGGTVHITLKVGLGKPIAHILGDPSKNWLVAPTTVHNKRTSFPNWALLPRIPPAPFDFEIPFASKYLYAGALALAWEMTWTGHTTPNSRLAAQHFDSAMRKNVLVDSGTHVGTGCGSFDTQSKFLTAGPAGKSLGMQVSISGVGGPAGSPVLWSIDLKDSNLTIPGWCAKVHVLPTVLIPLGTVGRGGMTAVHGFAFPYNKAIEGASVFSQLVSSNSGNLVLARANKNTIPASNTNNEAFESAQIWHPLTTTTAGIVTYGGSIVARLKY
jgi:hypothetical protein